MLESLTLLVQLGICLPDAERASYENAAVRLLTTPSALSTASPTTLALTFDLLHLVALNHVHRTAADPEKRAQVGTQFLTELVRFFVETNGFFP
jgi:hypothetical protein